MSHGYLGHIYTADCETVAILEDIAYSFYPDRCPKLAGKPKIFFIQACQDSGTHRSVASQGTMNDGEFSASDAITGTVEADADPELCTASETTKRTLLLPDAPDFFMSYATLPRSLAYRADEGTWYIQALTDELKKCRELQDSLDKVAQRVERKSGENQKQQRPFYYVSSDHKLLFLCGKLVH